MSKNKIKDTVTKIPVTPEKRHSRAYGEMMAAELLEWMDNELEEYLNIQRKQFLQGHWIMRFLEGKGFLKVRINDTAAQFINNEIRDFIIILEGNDTVKYPDKTNFILTIGYQGSIIKKHINTSDEFEDLFQKHYK